MTKFYGTTPCGDIHCDAIMMLYLALNDSAKRFLTLGCESSRIYHHILEFLGVSKASLVMNCKFGDIKMGFRISVCFRVWNFEQK